MLGGSRATPTALTLTPLPRGSDGLSIRPYAKHFVFLVKRPRCSNGKARAYIRSSIRVFTKRSVPPAPRAPPHSGAGSISRSSRDLLRWGRPCSPPLASLSPVFSSPGSVCPARGGFGNAFEPEWDSRHTLSIVTCGTSLPPLPAQCSHPPGLSLKALEAMSKATCRPPNSLGLSSEFRALRVLLAASFSLEHPAHTQPACASLQVTALREETRAADGRFRYRPWPPSAHPDVPRQPPALSPKEARPVIPSRS